MQSRKKWKAKEGIELVSIKTMNSVGSSGALLLYTSCVFSRHDLQLYTCTLLNLKEQNIANAVHLKAVCRSKRKNKNLVDF